MPKYTFEDLSPIDFEELTRDLLQKHLKITLESFKEGKDSGIDLRYSKANKSDIIIQCKRYSKLSDLKNNLKKEFLKVKLLQPKRYVLVTSVALTPNNKKEIQKLFKNIKLLQKDILGKNDLNNLLSIYEDIEKKHFKLWLNSSAILDKILHSKIYNLSEFEKEKIEHEIKIYVSSEANLEASKILDENNYVIISGIPGIGKTTLARILIFGYLLKDWQLISISNDITEADTVYNNKKPQVFYYDDFLGKTAFEDSLNKNEDLRLIQFIEKIKKSKNKKFILTTREYILNQAKQKYESFQDENIDLVKCLIDLKKYTKLIRGKILYNHLLYSNLNLKYIQNLLVDTRYLTIINHQNYSPRLISYLTTDEIIKKVKSIDYFNFFIDNLANPIRIWEFAYTSHISPVSRYLLVVFLSMGEPVYENDLYEALSTFFSINASNYGILVNKIEFKRALKECERTFLSISKNLDEQNVIRFQNPSIKDFLIRFLGNEEELVTHLLQGAIFFNQFFDIYTISKNQQKIELNNDQQEILFTRIEPFFYTCKISNLRQKFNSDLDLFYWSTRNYDYLERLRELCEFFNINENKKILEFLIKEFEEIELSKEVFGWIELRDYLFILNCIVKHITIDPKEIISNLFNKYNLDQFLSIKEIEKLSEIFPQEYEEFQILEEEKVRSILKNIFDEEYRFVKSREDISLVSEFIDQVSHFSEKYRIDPNNYLDYAESLRVKLEEKDAEEVGSRKKNANVILSNSLTKKNEDELLKNIFDSLRSKV